MPLSEAVLVIALLLILALVAAGVCRWLPLPHTVLLVVAGMAIGALSRGIPALGTVAAFRIEPELVLFAFLPALIFESALNLDARRLARDLAPVLVLAIPALLISTALVGLGLWGALAVPPLLAVLFGALISATDPVAVISLFKELGAPARLTVMLEGESLLNDATAIVAFTIVLGLVSGGVTLDATVTLEAAWRFIAVFLGGLAVGVAVGLLLGELLRLVRTGASSVLAMSIVMAYVSFVVAEHHLHVSGVMAAAGAALAFGFWGVTRIPPEDAPALHETWELIVLVCNSLLFLLVGLSVEPGDVLRRGSAVIVAVVLVLAARAAVVYGLLPLAIRWYALPPVSPAERHVMWWGGLKGGLAIAMALAIPQEVAGRDLVLDLTVGVVVFMLLVNAPTIRPLMGALGLDRMSADERTELAEGMREANEAGHGWVQRLRASGAVTAMQASRARRDLDRLLEAKAPQASPGQLARHLRLDALRAENDTLEDLHAIGLISQYIFIDMRALVNRDRERGVRESASLASGTDRENAVQRLERTLLRMLRERSALSGLLARYQGFRISHALRRTIAGILTSEAALAAIEARDALPRDVRERIAEPYRERLARRRTRLARLRGDFPDACRAVGTALAARVSLAASLQEAGRARHAGRLGAKAYASLRSRLERALRDSPGPGSLVPAPDVRELVPLVPLLAGLSGEAIEAITQHAVPVDFLPGDVVIGEGERGDSLYIVARGHLSVHRERGDGPGPKVAELSEGQFFGEMALLGEQVRTATVVADTACTLVRLTRQDVMAIAEENEVVRHRLDEARRERAKETEQSAA